MSTTDLELNDPRLAPAIKIIEVAIAGHCKGGDLWMCSAIAARAILQDIVKEAMHHHTGCEPGPWKRMPPQLRAAIAKTTGADHA